MGEGLHDALLTEADDYYNENIDQSASVYDVSVTASVYATGEGAVNSVVVKDGSVTVQAGSDASPAVHAESGVGYVSGVYADQGGSVEVKAHEITVGATSGGLSDEDQSAVVTGVRSNGASVEKTEIFHSNQWGGWTETTYDYTKSVVNLKSSGDTNVKVEVADDCESHGNITYAGVAATNRGEVNISSDRGSVNIEAENTTGSGTGGLYGLYSGLGLDGLLTPKDFPYDPENGSDDDDDGFDESKYAEYMNGIINKYSHQAWERVSNEKTGNDEWANLHKQSEINITAYDDVNVSVNLGAKDVSGPVSGAKAEFGDINITAGKNIDISVSHEGVAADRVSAVEIRTGSVNLNAENGDIRLSVESNGKDVSVIYSGSAEDALLGDYLYEEESGRTNTFSGRNVLLTGESGAGAGAGQENTIAGIKSFGKKETFVLQADEKAAIDVTAHDRGAGASSTGVVIDNAGGEAPYVAMFVDAFEFEVNARVVADSDSGNSRATGLLTQHGGNIGIYGTMTDAGRTPRKYTLAGANITIQRNP